MAETTEQTGPADAGHTTTEFKLTTVVVIIGTVLEGAAAILHGLEGVVSAPWIPIVLTVIGFLLQVAALLGYQASRTAVKTALIAADRKGLEAAKASTPPTAAEVARGEK